MRRRLLIITTIFLLILAGTGSYMAKAIYDLESSSQQDEVKEDTFTKIISQYAASPISFLLVTRDQSSGCTDTIIVVNYNPKNEKISLLNIPRDTKVSYNGSYHKINSGFNTGGYKLMLKWVNDLLGIDLKYYIWVELSTVRKIVDELGGVYYDVPIDMKYNDKSQDLHIDIKAGPQLLNGKQVEHLLRYRHPNGDNIPKNFWKYYDKGDLKRLENQQKFLHEFFEQKANITIIDKLKDLLNIVFDSVETNIEYTEAVNLASTTVNLINKKNVLKTFRINGIDEGLPNWYYRYNEEIINSKSKKALPAKKILDKYFK